jgi:chromosome segregation ATPase
MRGFWLSAVVGASAASVSPVEKVIQLLETLQSKVVAEGSAEAKTYDSFACFCKDQSKAKTKAIEENETLIDSLSAEMDEQRGIRKTKDGEIVDLQTELSGYNSEVKATKAAAKTRKEKYAVEIQDVTGAIKALEGAIDVLKSSDKTGMRTSLLSMKKTLRTVGVLAQAMGMGSTMLMQAADIPDVPTSDYDFHSNDILATLDELLGEFRKTAQRVDEEEVTAKTATTAELQSLSDSIAATEKSLKDAEAAKSAAEEAIGQLSGDFSIATATRNDDQNYLKDLTDKCNKKSDLWDQRTKMRQDELSALTGALVELKGSVTENNSRTIRLDQEAVEFVQTSRKTVRAHHAVRMLNAVQKHSHVARRGFMQTRDPRDQVIEMLRSKAEQSLVCEG